MLASLGFGGKLSIPAIFVLAFAVGGVFGVSSEAAAVRDACTPGPGMEACWWASTCDEECVPQDCQFVNCNMINQNEECIKCMDIMHD